MIQITIPNTIILSNYHFLNLSPWPVSNTQPTQLVDDCRVVDHQAKLWF